MPDPSVIAALEAAVVADPDNGALRLHLAGLLIEGNRPDDALGHLERVLAARPDHADALALAWRAAELSGDGQRAASWRRLHEALSGQPASDDVPMPEPPRGEATPGVAADGGMAAVPAGGEAGDEIDVEHDWDGVLREVLGDPGYQERVTLADVGGLEEVKRRLNSAFLAPLRNPKLRRMYGKSLRGGLLLWGPPGCGKTFLARAVAGELGARFVSVGLHDVLDMWLGKSEQNLHGIFEAARRQAPCVLFLDELDALGHKRTNLARSAGRNVVVQLLSELDGVANNNEGVFVLGATNQPWDVDPALRRPGRFDRTILVLPPDAPAREVVLRYHLRDRPVAEFAAGEVTRRTEGFSGADLRLLCEAGAERALEDSIASGVARPITLADILEVLKDLRPSTRAWFEVARNYATFANDGGEYDELLAYVRRNRLH